MIGQTLLAKQHHLREIHDGRLMDSRIQGIGELQRKRRIGVLQFRQRHLAVQMLVGIEVTGDGPGGRIGSEGELRPLPDDPDRILRNRIPVAEAQAVVKDPEFQVQAHAGIVFQMQDQLLMAVLHFLVLPPGLVPGFLHGTHLGRLQGKAPVQDRIVRQQTQQGRFQERLSVHVHAVGRDTGLIQAEPDGDAAVGRSDGGFRSTGRGQKDQGRKNGLSHFSLKICGPGPGQRPRTCPYPKKN